MSENKSIDYDNYCWRCMSYIDPDCRCGEKRNVDKLYQMLADRDEEIRKLRLALILNTSEQPDF